MMIEMKKKNKRSYFKVVEDRKHKARVSNLLKYIPNQPKLIQFLIDNEADEGFIKGLQNTTATSRRNTLNREDKRSSICSSFTWRDTKEGHSYWDELNDKFNEWFKDNQ